MDTIKSTSRLNPHAKEFVPGYCCSTPVGLGTDGPASPDNASNGDHFPLKELPEEMLACVVAKLAPQDLSHCLLVNHQLVSAVQAACVSYSVTDNQKHVLSNPTNSHLLDKLVKAVVKYMPAMVACNLAMLPLEHCHISSLASGLAHLAVLDLSGCKKLQPGVTKIFQQQGMLPRLQCLNLQRCFQLTDACLSDLIAHASRACGSSSSSNSNSSLQCIALSHLNLSGWPLTAAAAAPTSSTATSTDDNSGSGAAGDEAAFWHQQQQVVRCALLRLPSNLQLTSPLAGLARSMSAPSIANSSSNLRVVVLNNCSLLPVEGLITLAATCPHLEFLMLGGSSLKASWEAAGPYATVTGVAAGLPSAAAAAQATDIQASSGDAVGPQAAGAYVPPRVAAAAAAAGVGGSSTGSPPGGHGGLELPAALQQLAVLLQLPTVLPWEELSTCCPEAGAGRCGQLACSCCGDSSTRAAAAVIRAKARTQLHRNEPSAAALAAARGHALALVYAAALLPQLKAMEVTFMAPGVAGWLRFAIQQLQLLRDGSFSSSIGTGLCELPEGLARCGIYRSGSNSSTATSCGSNMGGSQATVSDFACDDGCDCSSISSSSASSAACYTKVWEFSCITAVQDALTMLQQCANPSSMVAHGSLSSGGPAAASDGCRDPLNPACLATALRCAVNSSSRGRSTPLHMAAERGCARHATALLQAGAAAAARDTSGASPLFVAAEAGRAATVAVLLENGADPVVGNTAGETALYIAALRGHLPVVELLLQHFSAAEVDWLSSGLYGDGWSPLMAAAVANRVDVALCLLRAATKTGFSRAGLGTSQQQQQHCKSAGRLVGQHRRSIDRYTADNDSSSSSGKSSTASGIERLLAAENRYGATALHIAARKGSREMLQLLVLYGGMRVAGRVMDAAGDTPFDVARRHGHEMALHELMQQC